MSRAVHDVNIVDGLSASACIIAHLSVRHCTLVGYGRSDRVSPSGGRMFRFGTLVRRCIPFAALIVLAALLGFGPVRPAVAQTTNGAVAGIVTDAQGGVLPGVTVTLRNTDTGLNRNIVTEGDGRYRVGGLPPGRYELRAELQGFGSVQVTDILLQVGAELLRNVTLQL